MQQKKSCDNDSLQSGAVTGTGLQGESYEETGRLRDLKQHHF